MCSIGVFCKDLAKLDWKFSEGVVCADAKSEGWVLVYFVESFKGVVCIFLWSGTWVSVYFVQRFKGVVCMFLWSGAWVLVYFVDRSKGRVCMPLLSWGCVFTPTSQFPLLGQMYFEPYFLFPEGL